MSGRRGELLAFSNVRKRLGREFELQPISFSIAPGVVHALLGSNGSGKTTVFNLISGFLKPDSGEIRVSMRDIANLSPSEISALGVSRLFQQVRFLPTRSVFENVALGGYARGIWNTQIRDKIPKLLKETRITHLASARPSELNYVELRRMDLARALLSEPQLLLLDEPTSGMTHEERVQFAEILSSLKYEGMAVLLIEHDLTLVEDFCNEVTILDLGAVVFSGGGTEFQALGREIWAAM